MAILAMAILSKFFDDVMSLIIRQNAGKKIISNFELFIKQNIEFKFVLFLIDQTLCTYIISKGLGQIKIIPL